MASLTRCTSVWLNSRSWWWTRRPGVLRFMGSQSWTWLSDWTELFYQLFKCLRIYSALPLPATHQCPFPLVSGTQKAAHTGWNWRSIYPLREGWSNMVSLWAPDSSLSRFLSLLVKPGNAFGGTQGGLSWDWSLDLNGWRVSGVLYKGELNCEWAGRLLW